MTINTRSLSFRLVFWYTLLLGVISLGFGAYTYYGLKHYLITSLQRTLLKRAEQIAEDFYERANQIGEKQLIDEIKAIYNPEVNDRFIRVSRNDGNLLYLSGSPKDGSFDPKDIGALKTKFTNPYKFNQRTINGHLIYIVAIQTSPSKNNTSYIVEVGSSDQDIQSSLESLVKTLSIALPCFILFAATGGFHLVQKSLTPVTEIMKSAEEITSHNLSARLPVPNTRDNLEHLSRALNRMIARIDESFQQIKRFTTDASHELRTPLTIIKGELEFIFREETLSSSLKDKLESILEETERLTAITENLFTISRLDAGESRINNSIIDLGVLTNNITEQILLLAEEKKIKLKNYLEPNVEIYGDSSRLKQVLVNLLDNAIKYTPEEGSITLKTYSQDSKAILEVNDSGIGIPEEALPYIFDRFYRADEVRERGWKGAGLGLSIAQSIVQAHAGNIQAYSKKDTGTKFVLSFPLAKRVIKIEDIKTL